MSKEKWFVPLQWKALVSEAVYLTIIQILNEENIPQLKILYDELRSRIPQQNYKRMKRAINEEKQKNIDKRDILSVLAFYEGALEIRSIRGKRRRGKTKNVNKRIKRNRKRVNNKTQNTKERNLRREKARRISFKNKNL